MTISDAASAPSATSYRGLRSRELNEALQYLGAGPNWRLVFDIFHDLCEASGAPIAWDDERVSRDDGDVSRDDDDDDDVDVASPPAGLNPLGALDSGDDDPAVAASAPAPPNAHVATTVLSVAGRRGDLAKARAVFSWMRAVSEISGGERSRVAPTAFTYTAYIQALGAADDDRWREAFAVYREMRVRGVTPTSHTYSALIRAGAKGGRVGASAACALVEDMRADRVSPDVPVASALICAYGVAGQFANAERMLRAVEAVTRAKHDEETARRAKAERAARERKNAREVKGSSEDGAEGDPRGDAEPSPRGDAEPSPRVPSVPSSPFPDAKLYTEFLVAACRCGRPEKAVEVFEQPGFPRTTYTCTAAIKAYGECDRWRDAEATYAEMCKGGRRRGVAPSRVTHVAVLAAYEKCEQWERAVAFLARLREASEANANAAARGSQDDALLREIHYNIALSACGKCGRWREAEALFEEMRSNPRTPPSAVTYGTLISAYGRGGEEDRARARFAEMRARGFAPDDYAFVGLMQAPASRGDVARCAEIEREMRAVYALEPTVHVYNELIRAAEAGRQYETAVEWFQTMRERGVEPNATTRELLTRVGKKGVEFYEDQTRAASFATLVAGLVGVAGMMAGRW